MNHLNNTKFSIQTTNENRKIIKKTNDDDVFNNKSFFDCETYKQNRNENKLDIKNNNLIESKLKSNFNNTIINKIGNIDYLYDHSKNIRLKSKSKSKNKNRIEKKNFNDICFTEDFQNFKTLNNSNNTTSFSSLSSNNCDFSKTFYSKKSKLSSEEIELLRIKEEKIKIKQQIQKNKINKIKAFIGEEVVNHKSKKLTKFLEKDHQLNGVNNIISLHQNQKYDNKNKDINLIPNISFNSISTNFKSIIKNERTRDRLRNDRSISANSIISNRSNKSNISNKSKQCVKKTFSIRKHFDNKENINDLNISFDVKKNNNKSDLVIDVFDYKSTPNIKVKEVNDVNESKNKEFTNFNCNLKTKKTVSNICNDKIHCNLNKNKDTSIILNSINFNNTNSNQNSNVIGRKVICMEELLKNLIKN